MTTQCKRILDALLLKSHRQNCELIENVMGYVIGNGRQFLLLVFPHVFMHPQLSLSLSRLRSRIPSNTKYY